MIPRARGRGGGSPDGFRPLVVHPVDDRTTAVPVDRDHRVDVRPDRDRGRATAPLVCDRAVGGGASLGDDADSAHAGRIFVSHSTKRRVTASSAARRPLPSVWRKRRVLVRLQLAHRRTPLPTRARPCRPASTHGSPTTSSCSC